MESTKGYEFTNYFYKVFRERVGIKLNSEIKMYILDTCNTYRPHRKIDNKGRDSEYFTMRINNKLITIVCDGTTHKIITCVVETHHRKEFENL